MVRVAKEPLAPKVVHKRRSEDEMRKAVATLAGGVQENEHVVILQDCIDELLETRQLIEEVRMFAGQWLVKLTTRK